MAESYVLNGIDETVFECAICMEKYQNPKALACGHVFCGSPQNCMKSLERDNGIKCPLCRTQHNVREADLKPNIFIKDVLEKAQKKPNEENHDSPSSSRSVHTSSVVKWINSGYTPKSGDFCRIHNLERRCTEPHFGTVRAIVTVQSPMKTCIGLELVKSCGCSMTTDGTYSKKSYFKTNSKQALFVPPTFLELLFPKSGEEIPIKELDLVRAVIPMPNHKYKVLDAIVQEMEYDFLILQACQMEEWMFDFKVETLKVSGKFPNPRNPEKFHIRLPRVFARRLFSPSKVCDGDICEMFVPDFATFQALVQCSDPAGDPELSTYTIELLDSDLPAGIEFPRGIQLIHGNVYSVKAFYLRCLHATLDNDHHDTESPTPEWAGPETFDHALRAGHSHTHKPSETLV